MEVLSKPMFHRLKVNREVWQFSPFSGSAFIALHSSHCTLAKVLMSMS